MAFPARTFRRLRRYRFDDHVDVPSIVPASQLYLPKSHSRDVSLASVESRTIEKCSKMNYHELIAYGEKIYFRYLESANMWTWLFSFIPGTSFHATRMKLEVINRFLQKRIEENFAKRQASVPEQHTIVYDRDLHKKARVKIFSYQKKSITYFPGWTKTLIVILLAVLMMGLILTGVGALASLGVFGATVTGAMVSSGFIFGQTAVGSFLFSMTTSAYFIGFGSAVAGVVASLLFHEWLRPGYLLRFVPFVGRHATQINTKHSLFNILNKVLFSQEIREEKYSKKEIKVVERWSPGNIIRFISNPLRWVEMVLQLAQGFVFRLAEMKSERNEASSFWRAALKQMVGEYIIGLALAPISFFKYITDLPFFVVKSVIYDLPRTLYKTTCGEMPKLQREEIPPQLRVVHRSIVGPQVRVLSQQQTNSSLQQSADGPPLSRPSTSTPPPSGSGLGVTTYKSLRDSNYDPTAFPNPATSPADPLANRSTLPVVNDSANGNFTPP